MLNACKEITKNPDNFGYLRENEGEKGGGRGGGFMVSVAGIIRTMTRLITPPSSINRNTFTLYLPKTS